MGTKTKHWCDLCKLPLKHKTTLKLILDRGGRTQRDPLHGRLRSLHREGGQGSG